MSRMASTSTGNPRCIASSMHPIAVWSISSSVAGTIPAARIALTAREASASRGNSARQVFAWRGRATRRSRASVIRPSVPSDPVKSPFRL
jgi:hypothetical protein